MSYYCPHVHGFLLDGPCQLCKSNNLLNQYPHTSTWYQMPGSFCASAIPPWPLPVKAPSPLWWPESVNCSSPNDHWESHPQPCPVAPGGVSMHEISGVLGTGAGRVGAGVQTTWGHCGNAQETQLVPSELSPSRGLDLVLTDLDPQSPLSWFPHNSVSIPGIDQNLAGMFYASPVIPSSNNDNSINQSPSLSPEVYCFEPAVENPILIPALPSKPCPHCRKLFKVKGRLSRHVRECSKKIKNPIVCADCNASFTTAKDRKRHNDTGSCPNGRPSQKIACVCGRTYVREDGLNRHIRDQFSRSDGLEHHAAPVGRSI